MAFARFLKGWVESAFGVRIYRSGTPLGLDLNNDLRRLVPDYRPRIIFDVGANVGQTSLYFNSLWPDAEIYAFEPVSTTYEQLTRAVAARGSKINCERIALSDQCGHVDIHLSNNSVLATLNPALVLPGTFSGENETVRTSTVQDWCISKGITEVDLLKVDAEGHDLHVLRGAGPMLKHQQIGAVLVEVHMGPDADPTPEAIRCWLRQFAYIPCGIYDQAGWALKKRFWGNFLFLPSRMLPQ